jgi:hypothetical protein
LAYKLRAEGKVRAAQLNILARLEKTLFGFSAICTLDIVQMEDSFGTSLTKWFRKTNLPPNYWVIPILFVVIVAVLIGILWLGGDDLFFLSNTTKMPHKITSLTYLYA